MAAWGIIFDANYSTALTAPFDLVDARAEKVLDGTGSGEATIPATDIDAINAVQNERVFEVWIDPKRKNAAARLLIAFVIKEHTFFDGNGGKVVRCRGGDTTELLKRRVTRPATIFPQMTILKSLQDITGLFVGNGWTATSTDADLSSEIIDYRFDGQNAYEVVRTICLNAGKHFRLGAAKTIEAGAFGDVAEIFIDAHEGADGDIINNGNVALLTQINIESESKDIANRISPISGGGDTGLTLSGSESGVVSDLGITAATGTQYGSGAAFWVYDSASETEWGQHDLRLKANIKPLSSSAADIAAARTALYKFALAELEKRKQPTVSYKLQITKLDAPLKVGDKIRLNYAGTIYKWDEFSGAVAEQRRVNDTFWIMRISEGLSGEVSLIIANVDREPEGAAGVIVGAVQEVQVQATGVQRYTVVNNDRIVKWLDSSNNAAVEINISDATFDLLRCTMRVSTRALKSPVAGPAATVTGAGGGFSGSVSSTSGSVSVSSGGGVSGLITSSVDAADPADNPHTHTYSAPSHSHSATFSSHTHSISVSNHTHTIPAVNLTWGIYTDTVTPDTVQYRVDGGDWSSSYAVGGGATTFQVGISADLKAATLQGAHTIEFKCASGRGEIEVQIERYELIQNVAVG